VLMPPMDVSMNFMGKLVVEGHNGMVIGQHI
jgi:hypothetical protein